MKRIWKRYLAALLVFTMVLNSTGATVLAETVRNGLVSHVQMKNTAQNLGLATGSNQINEEGELASTSDASSSDADIPCTKNDDCEALPGNHDIECPLYEGELLDDVSTPSNAILAMGFSEEDSALQYQQGKVGMTLEEVAFPETMVLTLKDLETGEEYEEETTVTWRLAQPADVAEFDTNLHTLLDEEGNPILDEKGMPVRDLLSYLWIFTPVLENSEDYDWSFLPDGYDSWNTYQEEQAGVYVQIGIMTLPEGGTYELHLGYDEIGAGSEAEGFTFDASTGKLVLTADGGTYELYPGLTSTRPVNISFANTVKSATVIMKDTEPGLPTLTLFTATVAPLIDFTGLDSATLRFEGPGNTLMGSGGASLLKLDNCDLTIAGGSNAGLSLKNEAGVIIEGGNAKITSGKVRVEPATSSGGAYPIVNSTVSISDTADFIMEFILRPGIQVPEETGFDDESNILFAEYDTKARASYPVSITYTAGEEMIRREFYRDMSFGQDGFVINLPAGQYRILSEEPGKGRQNLLGYAPSEPTKQLMYFSVDGLTRYAGLAIKTLPVFEESCVQDDSLSFTSVTLEGAVDTGNIIIPASGKPYVGTIAMTDKGFSIYEDENCTKFVGRWNQNGQRSGTAEKPVTPAEPDGSPAGNGGPFTVSVTGLTPGKTYWVRPYYNIGSGDINVQDYVDTGDYTNRIDALFSFTTPKVDWPTSLTWTYGTTVDAALARDTFENAAASEDETVKGAVEGVSYTFPAGTSLPCGSNLKGGRYHLYRDAEMHERVDETILDATQSTTFWIHYEPDPDSEDAGKYKIDPQPVTVTINKKPVAVESVESPSKVYDATTAAHVGAIYLGEDDLLLEDEGKVTVTADTANYVAADGTTLAKDVPTAKKISLTGLKLTGEKSENYNLTTRTKLIEGENVEITKRQITLSPKPMTQWAGAVFAPLEMEVIVGSLATDPATNEAEKINGVVVDAWNEITGALSDGSNYFSNVPGQNADIGPAPGKVENVQTVKLDAQLLNNHSKNYQIKTETEKFTFKADFPILNGTYTITSADTVQNNGWYNKPVTIAPIKEGIDADKYYKNGYDQIQRMKQNDSTAAANQMTGWVNNLTFDKTQDEVWIRLKNSTTGAYTFINQGKEGEGEKISLKIDTAAPTIQGLTAGQEATAESYQFTDENGPITDFLSKHLGNFFNRKVTVTVNLTDGTEGDPNVSGLWKIGWSYKEDENSTPIYEDKNTEDLCNGQDGVAAKEGVSFEIPEKQAGNVSFYVMDRAGNRTDYEVKAGDNGNYWIVENTAPKLDVTVQDEQNTPVSPAYTEGGNNWYSQKIYFKADVSDTTADGEEEQSGLYAVVRTINVDGAETKVELQDGLSDASITTPVYEKSIIAYSITEDSDPTNPLSITLDVMDNAGNTAETKWNKANILVDLTNPTLSNLTPDVIEDTNQDVTISFTASDNGSGLKSVTYAKQNSDGQTYGDETTVSETAEGSYSFPVTANGTYRVTVTDNVGHTSQKTITIGNIDKLTPAAPILTLNEEEWDKTTDDWQKTAITLTVTAEDKEADADNKKSGLATYTYAITKDGAAPIVKTETWNNAAANTIAFTENGKYTVTVTVTDKAGNQSKVSDIYYINIDTTNPVLKVDAKKHPSTGEEDYTSDTWSKDKLTFTLTNESAGTQNSGVDYQVKIGENGEWKTLNAANIGSLGLPEYVTAEWNETTYTLTLIGDMQETLTFRILSKAGLESNSIPYEVKLAQTAPKLPASEVKPEPQPTDWYNENNENPDVGQPTLYIPKPEETKSGSTVTVYYEYWNKDLRPDVQSGAEGITQKTITFQPDATEATVVLPDGTTTDGQYYWRVWITDEAGNEVGKTAVGQLVKIDETDPEIGEISWKVQENPEGSVQDIINKLTWGFAWKEGIQVTIPVTDALSGADTLYYTVVSTVDGQEPTEESAWKKATLTGGVATFLLDLQTSGIVKFYATDKAGNRTDTQNLGADTNQEKPIWVIENVEPNIGEVTYDGTLGDNDWYKTDVIVKTTIQDYGLLPDGTTGPVKDEDAANITAVSGLKSVTAEYGKEKTDTQKNSWTTGDRMLAEYELNVVISEEAAGIPIQIQAVDNAENQKETEKLYISIDKTAPKFLDKNGIETELLGNKEVLEKPSNADSYDLTFTIQEATSGLNEVSYVVTDGAVNPNGDPVPLTQDENGVYTLTVNTNATYTVTAKDNAGWVTTYPFTVNNFDRTPPENIKISLDDEDNTVTENGVYTSNIVYVDVEAEDPDETGFSSGLQGFWLAWSTESAQSDYSNLEWKGNENQNIYPYETQGKLRESGVWYLYAKVEDNAGNFSIQPYENNPITIDNGIPNLDVTPEEGYENWTKQNVSFEVSSVADLKDSLWKISEDGGKTYTTVNSQGESSLHSGKWTSTRLDKGWSHTFTAMPEKAEGIFSYRFYVQKIPGELSAESSIYTVKLDETAPRTPIASVNKEPSGNPVNSETAEYNKWFTETPILTLTPETTDMKNKPEGENTAPVTVYYKLWTGDTEPGEDAAKAYSSPLQIGEGITHVKYWAEDEAGNISASATKVFHVDTEKPGIVGDIRVEKKDPSALGEIVNQIFGNFFNSNLKVTVIISDNGASGIDKLTYTLEDADGTSSENTDVTLNDNKTEATFTLSVDAIDHKKLSVTLYDKAGHKVSTPVKGSSGSSVWTVENNAPVIETEKDSKDFTAPEPNDDGWYKEDVNLVAKVSDSSGLRKVEWSQGLAGEDSARQTLFSTMATDNAATESYDFAQIISREAENIVVTIYAEDNATNKHQDEVTLNIDKTAPVIDETAIEDDNPDTWVKENPTITFTVSDSLSKVNPGSIKVKRGTYISDTFVEDATPWAAKGLTITKSETAPDTFDVSFITEGNAAYRISIEDVAENVASYVMNVTKVDTVAPTMPNVTENGTKGDNDWYVDDVTLTITDSRKPEGEGQDSSAVFTKYQLWSTPEALSAEPTQAPDNTETKTWKSGDAMPKITESGYWHILIWGEDEALNKTPGNTLYNIKVDKLHPEIDKNGITEEATNTSAVAKFLNKLSFGNFFNQELKITIPLTDEGYSGVSKLQYQLLPLGVTEEGRPWEEAKMEGSGKASATAEFTIPISHNGTVIYYVKDVAGNQNETADGGFEQLGERHKLWVGDATLPKISPLTILNSEGGTASPNDFGWYNTNLKVRVQVNDAVESGKAHSGLASIIWSDGENEKPLPLNENGDTTAEHIIPERINEVDVTENGTKTYTVKAEDNALNAANPVSQELKLDTVKPNLVSQNPNTDFTTPTPNAIVVDYTLSDETSKAVKESITVEKWKDGDSVGTSLTVTTVVPEGSAETEVKGQNNAEATVSDKYTFTFTADENAVYKIKAADLAGNEVTEQIEVTNIDASAVIKPEVKVNDSSVIAEWYFGKIPPIRIENREPKLIGMWYILQKAEEEAPDKDGDVWVTDKATELTFDKVGESVPTTGPESAAKNPPEIPEDGKYKLYIRTQKDTMQTNLLPVGINVDTNAPDITFTEADLPKDWVQTEQIIHFSITDAEAEASTVDVDTIVLMKDDTELEKVTAKPATEDALADGQYFIEANDKGGYDGYFKTNGNGTYTIAASDVAGNAFAEAGKEYKEITVSNIDTDDPFPAPKIEAVKDSGIVGNAVEGQTDKNWYTKEPDLEWTTAKLNTDEDAEGTPGTSEVTSIYEKYSGTEASGTPETTSQHDNSHQKIGPTVIDGIWTFKTWAEDAAGHTNKDQAHVSTYWVDTVKPTIEIIYNTKEMTSQPVTVTLKLTDETSKLDLDTLKVNVTNPAGFNPALVNERWNPENTVYTVEFEIPTDKNGTTYTVTVADNAGNKTTSQAETVDWIDASALTRESVVYDTTSLTSGKESGWFNSYENVTITKAKDGVAAMHTKYRFTEPGATAKEEYDGTITGEDSQTKVQKLSKDGVWLLDICNEKQVEEANHAEFWYKIRIDTNAPVISDIAIKDENTWTNGDQTVTFTVTDPTDKANDKEVSGVDANAVTVTDPDGQEVAVDTTDAGNGNYKFTATRNGVYKVNAKDNALNEAKEVSVIITHIDKTAPENIEDAAIYFVEGTIGDDNWWRAPNAPKITMDIPSHSKDEAPVQVWYQLDYKPTEADRDWTPGTETKYIANTQLDALTKADGIYQLTVWTRDEAGNSSDKAHDVVKEIKVDTKAPEPVENGIEIAAVSGKPMKDIGNFLTFGNFFKEKLKVTVTAEDATSGTKCLYSSVDATPPDELLTTDRNRTEMEDGKASFDIHFGISPVRYAKFKLGDKAGNVSDVVFLVKGDKGSADWIIETNPPEITDFKADRQPNDEGWYNNSVTFTAKVTDAKEIDGEVEGSYLNKVDWLVTDDSGASTNTKLFARLENEEKGTPEFAVSQTIDADGQTTVDIYAQDNALNESYLSKADPNAVRTIKIDTKKPVIQYVSGNPDKWTSDEQTITFTVTDTPKTEGILHSGVDDTSVKVSFTPSSGNTGAQEGEINLESSSRNGNTWTYTFQTRGNGTYTVNAKDIAGNAATEETIKVEKINSTNLEKPGTDEKGNRGYVKWNEHTGEDYKDSSDSVIGWYANGKNPEITIRNSHAGPDDMPIYTVYKLWNTANNEPEMFKQIGFDESSLNPKTVTITDGINWTDGTWKLAAWNIPAAGAPSSRAEWTFMVDNTAPTVSETPEELKEINTDGWQKFINKLSFGLFYKEAIQVTVQVEDVTSHGETLYYQIETEKDGKQELVTGDAKIELTDDNSTIGYAKFTLPIGTKGKIAMWAEDFAGNVSAEVEEDNHGNLLPDSIGQVYLGYNGATWWELENTAPVITEISPVMDEKDVSVYLQGIVLTFNERVTAAEGKTVTISTGGEYYDYTLTEEDTKQIYLASPANADMDMDTPENVHGTYKVTLPINKFAERTTGESLSLSYNTDYIIRAEKGAFLDLATNEQVGGVYSVFTTEDDSKAEVPTIADLDVTGGQFIQIYPEFSSDNTEYVIVVADGALNEDKTQLAQDLILKAALTGDVELTEAVLKNFMGVTIDDDLSIQDTAAGSNVIVSADLIQAKENYILQLTISDHGKEQTYTFYVSTSAVTASTDYLTSGMPKVQVDTDELLVSLANEDLAQYLQKGLKVNIRMDISAPSLDSIPEEEAAFNALRTAMGEVEKHITYYPFDFTIWKAVSNGEMEKITRLREPITITIPIPSRIDLEDFRDVYRYHDGVPYKVQFTLNEAARTVTFEADEFSVYALAYYKEPSYSGGGGGGGGGGTGGGGGGGVVNVGSQVAYYGGAWQNDGWMFIKSDGTKPVNEWLNIDGKIYRFGLDGFMTTSFEKYQFNNDGSLAPASAAIVKAQAPVVTGTWLRDGWRYKTLSKTYLSGGWYYLYYNGLFDWYYFNDEGWMLDGWFAYGGETYYLHTTHDWSRGRMYMGWQVIDGKWYYFRMKADGKEGTLMRNSYTPDGHFVGADGAWDGRGSAPTAYVRK